MIYFPFSEHIKRFIYGNCLIKHKLTMLQYKYNYVQHMEASTKRKCVKIKFHKICDFFFWQILNLELFIGDLGMSMSYMSYHLIHFFWSHFRINNQIDFLFKWVSFEKCNQLALYDCFLYWFFVFTAWSCIRIL